MKTQHALLAMNVIFLLSVKVNAAPLFTSGTNTVQEMVDQLYSGVAPMSQNKAMTTRGVVPNAKDNRCVMKGNEVTSVAANSKRFTLIDEPTTEPVIPVIENPVAAIDMALSFRTDSDLLMESDKALLRTLAKAMNDVQILKVVFAVLGHTDTQGNKDHNLQLSCSRAFSVKKFLVEQGVDANRLTPYGFGSDRLLDKNKPISAANRRVEIRRGN
jgi:outer membrane protein OmpA-like peptidoglycan-associated protein